MNEEIIEKVLEEMRKEALAYLGADEVQDNSEFDNFIKKGIKKALAEKDKEFNEKIEKLKGVFAWNRTELEIIDKILGVEKNE